MHNSFPQLLHLDTPNRATSEPPSEKLYLQKYRVSVKGEPAKTWFHLTERTNSCLPAHHVPTNSSRFFTITIG